MVLVPRLKLGREQPSCTQSFETPLRNDERRQRSPAAAPASNHALPRPRPTRPSATGTCQTFHSTGLFHLLQRLLASRQPQIISKLPALSLAAFLSYRHLSVLDDNLTFILLYHLVSQHSRPDRNAAGCNSLSVCVLYLTCATHLLLLLLPHDTSPTSLPILQLVVSLIPPVGTLSSTLIHTDSSSFDHQSRKRSNHQRQSSRAAQSFTKVLPSHDFSIRWTHNTSSTVQHEAAT